MLLPSDRRRGEQAAVGVVEGPGRGELVDRVRGAPLVGDLGAGEVVQVRVPGVLVDLLQLGGVLDGVAVRVEEVAEGVVAGQVPSRPPDLLHAGPQQPAGAAHVLVDAAQLERGVVQRRVRAAGDGRTGIDSPTSTLRCARTATPALTSIVRPSLSKNRNPYPPPGVASAPGSLTSRTPSAASRAASASTSAELAAPNAIRSTRWSSACRSRTSYCSGEPS